MPYIKLICWNQDEAAELAKLIKIPKVKIDLNLSPGAELFKDLQNNPPSLFIIDLSRLPSQGRDMALMVRQKKVLQTVPIIFVNGDKEKVNKIKKLLPDAFYTEWENINSTIPFAIENAPVKPIIHNSVFAAYAGTPLITKLGIISNTKLVTLNAPDDFVTKLGTLPENVVLKNRLVQNTDLIIWFAESEKEVVARIVTISDKLSSKGKVWIAWRKKAAGAKTDLTQVVVRKIGLASGLVDYKICSIDNTWSALLFTKRK